MMQLAENKYDTEISPASNDSIDNFLASSVHDMKNSVTLLLSGLEKTLGSPEAAKLSTYSELMQANHEAKRIHNQLVQLLSVYKLGQKIYPFDPQYICLADFLSALNDQYAGLLRMNGIALEIDADPDLYWYFDEDLVSGVIGNAINNAMRYTRDRIVIGAEEFNKKLILRIEDNGDGYPSQFIRQQNSVVQSVNFHEGNTGLGFYFSTLVARMHQNHGCVGIFELKNGGSLGGACFILQLP